MQRVALGPQVADALRQQIIGRDLLPGSLLVEDALAEQYGVSRGPIRDALRQLEAEGLVQRSGRSYLVVDLTPDEIADIYSLREVIEVHAVELAMRRAEPAELARAHEHVEAMREAAAADDHGRFGQADIRFHSALYELAKHRRLLDVWTYQEPILRTLIEQTVDIDSDLHASAHDHEVLLRLIQSGDAAGAVEELRAHLHRSRDRMLELRTAMAGGPQNLPDAAVGAVPPRKEAIT
ncbi:MAG TPA: GntR family transcriptional regulator [Naasia sp.]